MVIGVGLLALLVSLALTQVALFLVVRSEMRALLGELSEQVASQRLALEAMRAVVADMRQADAGGDDAAGPRNTEYARTFWN